jgi:hypothetical protein
LTTLKNILINLILLSTFTFASSIESKVVIEHKVGSSYWDFTGELSTFIKQKDSFRLEVITDEFFKMKYLTTDNLNEIRKLVKKVNKSKSWKNYEIPLLCDSASVTITKNRKKSATQIGICGTSYGDIATNEFNELNNYLMKLILDTRNNPDAVHYFQITDKYPFIR